MCTCSAVQKRLQDGYGWISGSLFHRHQWGCYLVFLPNPDRTAWSMSASLSFLALDVANNSTLAGRQDPPAIWIQLATRDCRRWLAMRKPQSAARVGHEPPANRGDLDCRFNQKARVISEMSSVIIRMAETEMPQIASKVLWEIAYLCFFHMYRASYPASNLKQVSHGFMQRYVDDAWIAWMSLSNAMQFY